MPTRKDRPRAARRGGAVRRFAGKVLRRGARRLDAAQARLLQDRPSGQDAADGLVLSGRLAEDGAPAVGRARESFFRSIERDGDLALAAVTVVREYLEVGTPRRARTFAQVLQQEQGHVHEVGDICMGVFAANSERAETVWNLLGGAALGEVLRLAPVEYFRAGFLLEPEATIKALDAVARGELSADTDAEGWLEIGCKSFAVGAEELSRYALGRARAGLADLGDDRAARRVRATIAWLRSWYGRAGAATEPVPRTAGEIPVAVLSYRQPDRSGTSRDLGDYLETLASLTQLARRTGIRFSGDPELVAFADLLRGRISADRVIDGADALVHLYEVDRDATHYAAVPDGTWLVVSGLLPRSMFGVHVDLPFNPRLRPIFISVHVDSADLLTAEVLDYLRAYAPVGCQDWSTVLLLQAAGIAAFFSGALTVTLDTVAPHGTAAPSGRLFVDTPRTRSGDTATQEFDAVRTRGLSDNLRDALQRVDDYRDRYRQVVTSRLRTYLAARAVGTAVEFRPDNPAQRSFDGLLDLDDAALAAMRQGILDKLSAVHDAIFAGKGEPEVYALWRELCTPDVEHAEARRDALPPVPPPSFDVAAACATIRSGSLIVERGQPAPDGEEINVELSLDGNYKHQLEVVLDSIVTHASRPIRAFVLCRDHTQADFDRLAALFPTVSFVWLPTDAVDHGELSGLISHTTVATMDRLLLPDLLPETTRIVHHDLDALCLADLAELWAVDLGGAPIAARTSPHASRTSGFASVMRKSERFRQRPELGREYLLRTHTRHRFDYQNFNAGIMLLDLAVMRTDGFCRNFLPYAERFGMHDQEVLNVYAGADRVELAAGWNWQPWLETVDEPKIAHWAGTFKPWKDEWVIGRELWREGEARVAARYAQAGLR